MQQKMDGVLCRLVLDSMGCIAAGHSSTGKVVALGDLVGVRAGAPRAVLVGELEANTEASLAAIAQRGYRVVHLFDCLHDGQRALAGAAYRDRRDALLRMTVEVESLDTDRDDRHHSARQRRRGGRFGSSKPFIPRSWRRVPVVPQVAPGQAGELWSMAEGGLIEGLVLVNQGAPAGAPRSKLKCKPWTSIDCEVVADCTAMLRLRWSGGFFNVGRKASLPLSVGNWVEVQHNGFLTSGEPKHPRQVRRRYDLEPGRVLELDALPGDLAARLRPDAMTPVEPWRRSG